MPITILIPVYNALPLAKQCLESIFAAGPSMEFEIVVVDNGSSPDVEAWLIEEERLHPNLRHLRYAEPLGFARAVNVGAASATGEVLIILNSDTIVTPRWMESLHQALDDDPSLGAITPCTNHAGEPAQMDYGTIDLPPAKALGARLKNPTAAHVLHLPQRLTFFCVAVRRAVWLELGGLDEAYGVGNFEDDDFCLRLRVAGYRLGVARHVFVYHHNNATFHANRIDHSKWLAGNAGIFAAHARQCALAENPPPSRWPKRTAYDVSVVIRKKKGAPLGPTLLGLENQTVRNFEIILPDNRRAPTRAWIACLTQGDILYPFHLEALLDAMDRLSAEAIFADAWIADRQTVLTHPDTERSIRAAPFLLSGWIYHSSLTPARIYQQVVPLHWPRFTWEMQEAPVALRGPEGEQPRGLSEVARQLYRRAVPYHTRLAIGARLSKSSAREVDDSGEAGMEQLNTRLEDLLAKRPVASKSAGSAPLPAVIMLNAISWNAAFQRQQQFASGLARCGHPVFWVDTDLCPPRQGWTGRPLQQLAPDVHLVRLPGLSRDIYHLNWDSSVLQAMSAVLELVVSAYGIGRPVVLINYPLWQPLAMRLRERAHWKLVYDCLDDQSALAGIYQTKLGSYEDLLVEHADLLFTSSIVLQRHLARPSILLQNAADYQLFSSSASVGHLQHLPRPIAGYFGSLANWLDMDLIHAAALRFPTWSFVYIGPSGFSHEEVEKRWVKSTNLPNITVLPQQDQRTLAAHLADFDVCICPFLDIPVTRTMNPVKLYEYLAAGKPSIFRDLPEVRDLLQKEPAADDLVKLYVTPEEFFQCLEEAVASDRPEVALRRKSFSQQNDWSQRVEILSAKITKLAQAPSSSSASSSGSKTRSQE